MKRTVFSLRWLLLLLLLLVAGGMAGLNRYLLMSRVQADPEAVFLPTEAQTPAETDIPATETTEMEASSGCPTDSNDWSLTPTMISETYMVIQPACVYQGLEQTIAWALAVRVTSSTMDMNWSRTSASRPFSHSVEVTRR